MSGILPGTRSVQILRILYEHGPLSLRALREIITPRVDDRRLRDAISRLVRSGLVIPRFDSLPRNAGRSFQLSTSLAARTRIAAILDIHPDSLCPYHFRGQDLYHSESCALWTHRLSLLFPEAKLIRDFRFREAPEISQILLSSASDPELKPDIVMLLEPAAQAHRVRIAIEIERSRKTRKRLANKLLRYATRTLLDGVIYLCEKDALPETLRDVYQSQVMRRSLRTMHYGQNFILFSDVRETASQPQLKLVNASLDAISLQDWIQFLRRYAPRLRRDGQLNASAKPG